MRLLAIPRSCELIDALSHLTIAFFSAFSCPQECLRVKCAAAEPLVAGLRFGGVLQHDVAPNAACGGYHTRDLRG